MGNSQGKANITSPNDHREPAMVGKMNVDKQPDQEQLSHACDGGGDGTKDELAVPVHCSESGNISFEVVLSPAPKPRTPLRPNLNVTLPTSATIEERLKKAAERRLSLESDRVSRTRVGDKLKRAAEKRSALAAEFSQTTKEALEQEMETKVKRRDSILQERVEKALEEDRKVEEAQLKVQEKNRQAMLLQSSVEEKLQTATENREHLIQDKVEKLQQHDTHVEEVRMRRLSDEENVERDSEFMDAE